MTVPQLRDFSAGLDWSSPADVSPVLDLSATISSSSVFIGLLAALPSLCFFEIAVVPSGYFYPLDARLIVGPDVLFSADAEARPSTRCGTFHRGL